MELAIGGEFRAIGMLERNLLYQYGLSDNSYLIDIGCGSGRLAAQLAKDWQGRYLGVDVVEDLLDHAVNVSGRSEWRFVVGDGHTIPERDCCADFVCFFSVFTHLLHEESFLYLSEAKRVLVPGGKIIFSFLEFAVGSHWTVFEQNVQNVNKRQHLNQFMSRDGIQAWASHLGLRIEAIHDGDKPHIPLTEAVVFEGGQTMERLGTLGQSVCVLVKKT